MSLLKLCCLKRCVHFVILSNYLYKICESFPYLRTSIVFNVKVSPNVKEQKNFLFSTFWGTCSDCTNLLGTKLFVNCHKPFFATQKFLGLYLLCLLLIVYFLISIIMSSFTIWDKKKLLGVICEFYSDLLLDWFDLFERYLILLATGSLRTTSISIDFGKLG
jgi:hypothetical protein